jgi:thiopeptide-type bacteriocin biosynthesis protein
VRSGLEAPSRTKLAPAGFFALRTPLLPFDEIAAWTSGCRAADLPTDSERLDDLLAADRELLRRKLRAVLEQPEVREAVFLASPDLTESLPFWYQDPAGERGQRIERALVRYFVRMASRPTPFGLFAGCSAAPLGSPTRLELPPRAGYQRHTRLDMDYLFALADAFQRQPERCRAFHVRTNSSLYRAAGRFRYVEAKVHDKERSYHLVAVDDNPYVRATLEGARDGARPTDLAAALVAQDPDIAPGVAQAFIDELIANQLLITELIPAVTGPEPVQDLVTQLTESEPTRPLSEALARAAAALQAIDAAGLGAEPERYRTIARDLESGTARVDLARLFQVDLVKPVTEVGLGEAVIAELTRGVQVLHRLGRWFMGSDPLVRFRESFVGRYEAREVPLVEALDEELGIGFDAAGEAGAEASPLLEGLAFRPRTRNTTVEWEDWQSYLFVKLEACLRQGLRELELSPHDLDQLAVPEPLPLPDAFAVTAVLSADSAEVLARGDFQVLFTGAGGPSGARQLGRFCHADPRLHEYVRDHLRAEEALQPGAIFAEVVHLPEGRVGNVLCRPVLRDYEIPFLGRSGAPADRQIPITDLLVAVRGDDIVLWSRQLGCRVVPRLSTAHNYQARSLRVYKFLCALQNQGRRANLAWEWGLFKHAPFLPRVRVGRLVLARACWRLDRDVLQALGKLSGTALFRAVQTLRAERGLPRWALFAEGDNELLVDFDNVLAVETLIDLVKSQPRALLFEMFPGPERLAAHGPEGRFTHELHIPFTCRKEPTPTHRPAPPVSTAALIPRTFLPGSEWLYAKLYTGAATADQVLREVVGPLTREALARGTADGWFFLRYGDPDWHIRWRLHGPADRLRTEMLPRLEEAVRRLLDDGRVRKVQLDTYERELERYGGPEGIALSERIFQADSEAVLSIVELLSGDAGMDARWRLTLRGMDQLLTDLGLSWDEKRSVVRSARAAFARESPADPQPLGDKFRRERASLEKLLVATEDEHGPLTPGIRLLRRRSEHLAPIAEQMRSAVQAGRVAVPLPALAESYLHLHANRLLRSAQRPQEFVLYFLLDRLYEGRQARQKSGA